MPSDGHSFAFYMSVWCGIQILIALDTLREAAVFDGIASTGLPPNAAPAPAMAHRRAAVAHGTRRLRPGTLRRRRSRPARR